MKAKSVNSAALKTADLGDVEAVRKRPGLYIGNPDERGLETYVMEIVA